MARESEHHHFSFYRTCTLVGIVYAVGLVTFWNSIQQVRRGKHEVLDHQGVSFVAKNKTDAFSSLHHVTTKKGASAAASTDSSTDTTPPLACFINYKTPLERSMDMAKLYQVAIERGYGNCGNNKSLKESYTSLENTASAFAHSPASLLPQLEGMHSEAVGAVFYIPLSTYLPICHVTLQFHAMDIDGVPHTLGGDEFIVTLRGWFSFQNEVISFKTGVIAHDYGNGTYSATLPFPDVK
jgi:hypothetical protein